MRLRRVPNLKEKLAAMDDSIVINPEKLKGKWHEELGNHFSLQLELGTGKGAFLVSMAEKNPNINFIGLERIPDIIYKAALKKKDSGLSNIRLVLADVENLPCFFQPGEIARIYLNFSDPWPKKRHKKRCLTHPRFLDIYLSLLKKGGEIFLKTDNVEFFEYSLLSMAESGFSLQKIVYDLHSASYAENVMTEYEQRFVEQGKPICRCEAISPL